MIIDGTDLLLGRLATHVAKNVLLGEEITIVNCENVVISGNKKTIIAHYKRKRERGEPSHGPHFPRRADLIVKRTVRGMLPYKTNRGMLALKRVKCYLGNDNAEKAETLVNAKVDKLPNLKYMQLNELSKLLGAK
tara:strand:+ start:888 stop:1292 length:405 start_codon:yes stop_codon:yes gene_type:complete